MKVATTCSVEGCAKVGKVTRGMCMNHYAQWWRKAPAEERKNHKRRTLPPLQRLMSKVRKDVATGCWEWTGSIARTGYGKFFLHGRVGPAHRASYELLVAPIPSGLDLDHLCRNRACVNPKHLEPVTRRENSLRGVSPFIQIHLHQSGGGCNPTVCPRCKGRSA